MMIYWCTSSCLIFLCVTSAIMSHEQAVVMYQDAAAVISFVRAAAMSVDGAAAVTGPAGDLLG